MSEVVPSTLAHSQAVKLVRELSEDSSSQDFEQLIEKLAQILVSFQRDLGNPRLRYERVMETEPPLTSKTNRAWNQIEDDINILKQQIDVIRASVLSTHNIASTRVEEAVKHNARLENKTKTLQLFAVDDGPGVISFSDNFNDKDKIDQQFTPREDRPSLLSRGNMALGVTGEVVNHTESATITLGESSNGFLGNNQELESINDHPVNPVNDRPYYEFKAQNQDYRNFDYIADRAPDTWIEYESYHIPEDRRPVGVHFTYRTTDEDGTTDSVDWAQRPEGGVLKLQLNFDLNESRIVNRVQFSSKGFGEKDYPVFVRSIKLSPDGTNWTRIGGNTWIGSGPSLRTARTADDVIIGAGVWTFSSRSVRYVRVHVEQSNAMNVKAGYVYWVDKDNQSNIVDGPEPPVEEPESILNDLTHGDALQQRDYINAKRWGIGINDVGIMKRTYKDFASVVSMPLNVGGVVDRVILDDVNVTIPDEYPSDNLWVKFFVSPNNGDDWHQISPIQDDFNNVPQQIAYNDPTAEAFRESGVKYFQVDQTVDSLRFKIELSRPSGHDGTSPIVHSYSLKVLRRD